MDVVTWHVHGSYTTAFVQGPHRYLLPTLANRGPDGRGRADTWDWPASAVEVAPEDLRDARPDVLVAQRMRDLELFEAWTGLRPGRDVACVYLEHNTPGGDVPFTRHPLADRADLTVVHVTPFNATFWDSGTTRVRVVEHGLPDPGPLWSGDLRRSVVVVNDPVRRGRAVGTDLLPTLAAGSPLDVFGMKVSRLGELLPTDLDVGLYDDWPQAKLHAAMAERRVYVHPFRWTSLGLSLIEAMLLGMPVVAMAATEVSCAVPAGAGVVSTDVQALAAACAQFGHDQRRAADAGAAAREHALSRYGLQRFLRDWDVVLEEAAA